MNIAAITKLSPAVTRSFHHGVMVARKFSPEILTSVGVVGVVTAGVLASRATLNLEPIVNEMHENINIAKTVRETADREKYSDADFVRDKTIIYTRFATNVVKNYGPAITLGLASIGCIIGAHGIMRKRNVAVMAAYKTLETSFNKYRERVIEEFGEVKDAEYRFGKSQTSVIKDEDSDAEVKINVINPNEVSGYAKFFDEHNENWVKNPEYNLMFLKCQQNHANDMLHARGYVFLNDVYDMIGIPRTKEGQAVGWTLNSNGDNFIDFDIYNAESDMAREFVNGYERSILLDFNVDGLILDKF